MINFATLQALDIPEGKVVEIKDASGRVIWAVSGGDKAILEVEKFTSNTYAGETTYENEQFILLDIYPKTNGTVKVTYGGLTKTITDTSGAANPNAQKVFFGTFNGVSDSVATPASGELTIVGECVGFGCSVFAKAKAMNLQCFCICKVNSFGSTTKIPDKAFGSETNVDLIKFNQTNLVIPDTIQSIGADAFCECDSLISVVIGKGVTFIGSSAFYLCGSLQTVEMLNTTPPQLASAISGNYTQFIDGAVYRAQIIVPKGYGATYKAAAGWSTYADKIVEAS